MERDLLKDFVDQRLDIELVDIRVMFDGHVLQRAASGRLHTSPQLKLMLEYRAPLPLGHPPFVSIANEEKGLTIWAKTADGWFFSTHLLEIKPTSFYPQQAQAQWCAVLIEGFLRRHLEQSYAKFECFGYIDSLNCFFDKSTAYIGENGENCGGGMDWLQIENEMVVMEVRQGKGDWSNFKVVGKEGMAVSDFALEVNALLNALSLRMGRRVQAVCSKAIFGNIEQLCLSGFNIGLLRHSGNNPLVPLVMINKGGTNFVDTAQKYFRKNQDTKLLDLLFSVWDGDLLSREIHRLQTAIALESLSNYINGVMKKEGQPKTAAELTRAEEEITFSDLKAEVAELIEKLEWKFPGHLIRLKNVVKRTSLNDATPAIKSAGEHLGLNFSSKELKYWRDMRHPAAHGEPKQFAPKEEDFYSCQSMLYRLVLKLIGWDGPRISYGLDTPPTKARIAQGPVQTIDLGVIHEMKIGQ